jgi:DNA-binding SARP family transcriptional activator
LLRRVDGARTIALAAGAGTGKTVFSRQVAGETLGLRVRLAAGDDATTSAERLASAGRRAGFELPVDADLDGVLGAIARSADDLVVVVDDLHLAEPATAAELVLALTDLPARHRLVFAGRTRGWLAAVPTGATVFDDRDLALDPAEIAGLLGLDADDATVAEVAAATGGWVAGVVAAAERLAADGRWSAAAAGAAAALLGALVADVAEVPAARRAARVPLLDDRVLEFVGDTSGAVADLPTMRVGRWRALLPAIATALHTDADLPDELVAAIARHYVAHGEAAAAVRFVATAASPTGVTIALRDVPWSVFADVDIEVLGSAVDRAGGPDGDRAAVLLAAARAAELLDVDRRGRWLDAAAGLTVDATMSRAIAAERARYRLRSGDIDGGDAAAADVLAETGPDELVTRARALSVQGMAATYECTAEGFTVGARLYREAARLFARAGEVRWRADTLARLGHSNLFLAGRPVEGAEAMGEALALLPVGDLMRAVWLTIQADVLGFIGRDADAEAALREAIEIGTRRGDAAAVGTAWWSRSWVAAYRGDGRATRAALEEVERGIGAWLSGGQLVEYLTTSAEHLLLVGDLDGFRSYLARAEASVGAIQRDESMAILQAAYDCAFGDPVAGLAGYAGLEGNVAVVRIFRPRRLLFEAVGALRMGDEARAVELAAAAHADAADLGVPDLHQRQHRLLLELLAPVLGTIAPVRAPRLQLMGGFALTSGSDVLTPPPGHASTLVKVLALGGPLPSEAAVDMFWPDADLSTGRSRLRNALNRMKERSGTVIVREGEVLRLAPEIEVDVRAFEAAAAAALTAEPEERVGRARHALALYTGELLPGDRYDDWSTGPRARVQRRVLALADLVATDAETRGDLDEAARLLDLSMALEPLDEARAVRLAGLLTRQGHRAAAAAVARRCADLLEELDVPPSSELAAHL